jgi:hypothetical protein
MPQEICSCVYLDGRFRPGFSIGKGKVFEKILYRTLRFNCLKKMRECFPVFVFCFVSILNVIELPAGGEIIVNLFEKKIPVTGQVLGRYVLCNIIRIKEIQTWHILCYLKRHPETILPADSINPKPKEESMKIRTTAILLGSLVLAGCGVGVYDPGYHHTSETVPEPTVAYVNTWLNPPDEVLDLIAPSVDGYFSPGISRYDDYLYPRDLGYDPHDLPCFVRTDFNGDGYDDFAFLFSSEEWQNHSWYLTTKLIVVLSTYDGYELAADEVLGTVTGDAGTPIEEYWSIYLVTAGSHSVTYVSNGTDVTKTITLDNDAFYLASQDPDEEAIFYTSGNSVYETSFMSGAMGKKLAAKTDSLGKKQAVPFSKSAAPRKRAVQ